MGQDGIPMSIAILFAAVIVGAISFVGVIIAVVLSTGAS
jgi:hypothetical protein